ncbi:hypothetical protein AgCh_012184 [Apium graveolens]
MGRPPCCDKSNVKKGPWTPEEDAKVLAYVANHGIGNWTLVPEKAGLNRCGKSCRLRWTNYLRPDLKHDAFTPQEENHILVLHQAVGSRWSLIAKHLPGRTDNDVKNHWNTKLRKKLMKMGIDPVTHKPISHVLTDFGNISPFPNSRNHADPLNGFVNNFMPKPEASVVTTEYAIPTMLSRPMLEEVQDNHFGNNYVWENAETSFQVTNQEISSPLTSLASCHITDLSSPQSLAWQSSLLQSVQSSSSGWNDFLLSDLSLLTDLEQQEEPKAQGMVVPSSCPPVPVQNEKCENNFSEGSSSSAVDSFVDSILNQDKEMQSEFPQIFSDEYFNY